MLNRLPAWEVDLLLKGLRTELMPPERTQSPKRSGKAWQAPKGLEGLPVGE